MTTTLMLKSHMFILTVQQKELRFASTPTKLALSLTARQQSGHVTSFGGITRLFTKMQPFCFQNDYLVLVGFKNEKLDEKQVGYHYQTTPSTFTQLLGCLKTVYNITSLVKKVIVIHLTSYTRYKALMLL